MRRIGMMVMALCAVVVLVGCSSQGNLRPHEVEARNQAQMGCANCNQIMEVGTGWCDDCGQGMVDGEGVACGGCYVGATGGTVWCDGCGTGYVEGAKVACQGCVVGAQNGEPCADCAAGAECQGCEEGCPECSG